MDIFLAFLGNHVIRYHVIPCYSKQLFSEVEVNNVRLFPKMEVNGTGYPEPSTNSEGNNNVGIYQTRFLVQK